MRVANRVALEGQGGRERCLSVIREDVRQILHLQDHNTGRLKLNLDFSLNRPSRGDPSP